MTHDPFKLCTDVTCPPCDVKGRLVAEQETRGNCDYGDDDFELLICVECGGLHESHGSSGDEHLKAMRIQYGRLMRVFVIRNEDGAEVEDVPGWMPHYTTDDVYWWTEGNMSCDCNRHLEFERGQGRDPDAEDVDCGHGRYSVRLELDDGTVVE